MKRKTVGLACLLIAIMSTLAVPIASATTLEVEGKTQNTNVFISAGLGLEGALVYSRTDGTLANACSAASFGAVTLPPFTGSKVTASVSSWTITFCSIDPVTVDKAGQIYFEHESGTTNGVVFSENTEITVPTSLGFTVNCKTGEGTKIGTMTGTASGNATLHVNAVLNCGFLLPSASWKANYRIETLQGLGVSA